MRSNPTLLLAAIALVSCATPPLEEVTVTDDGAWCWFADSRSIHFKGMHDRTYTGWVTSQGDIVVAQHDHESGESIRKVVRAELDRDDHANPALLAAADGHITVFYSRHAGKAIHARTTVRPEDVTEWTAERTIRPNSGKYGIDRYCYPNPYRLAAEGDRIFMFWRGDHWKPTLSTSVDGGLTWSPGRIALMREGAGKGNRPYLKVASNDRDTIHLAFTDGHPRNERHNSIYYARYRGGRFEQADGTLISSLDELPFEPRHSDVVYDALQTGVRAWIWDVAADANGRPVIVYARLPAENDHRYHYARWNGVKWDDHELCAAGGWFPQTPAGKRESEPHYSGGVVLDHDDPSVVYLSRQVEGIFEIERWQTPDGGRSWECESVTSRSKEHNVRPVVVRGHSQRHGFRVLWMRLTQGYEHYTRFHTSIQAR